LIGGTWKQTQNAHQNHTHSTLRHNGKMTITKAGSLQYHCMDWRAFYSLPYSVNLKTTTRKNKK